jgi:HEAT repeat protein
MSTAIVPPAAASDTLAPELGALVTGFARSCRAAARAIALYPPEHPAVGIALGHLVEVVQRLTAEGEVRLSVLPDSLMIGGQRPARPDAAVTDLAALLHGHQVGQLAIAPQSDAVEWRRFLSLLALPPEQTRVSGGLAALWASEGQTRISARQIDYKGLLGAGIHGDRVTWQAIIDQCLRDDAATCDDWMLDLVLDILDRPDQVGTLLAAVEDRVSREGGRAPLVVAGLMQAVARFAAESQPDQLEPLLLALAGATAQMPLATLGPMASAGRDGQRPELAQFVAALSQRMRDDTLAGRVVEEFRSGRGSSPQLTEALGGLVPDVERRSSILALARHALAQAPEGTEAEARAQWHVEQLVWSHDDRRFIAEDYATELQRAAERAVEIEDDRTDGPDRLAAWAASVAEDRVRLLDAQLLVDLLQLKREAAAWREVAALVVARINVLVVLGDFSAAAFLAEALRLHHEEHSVAEVRAAARHALADIVGPDLMRHVASHLDTADLQVVAAGKRFCEAVGTSVIPRLAEVLSREERARSRRHLIAIFASFGAAGRQAVERLMQSPNAAVRRTAVQLLREFGGQEALPELQSLLNDEEPHVQREATYAIALLAMESAYATLTRALAEGSERSRDAITSVLWTLPAEATAGVLAHIVTHAPQGGQMRTIHERAIERLAAGGGPVAVRAINNALQRGSVMAPFRTAAMRKLCAQALARIGTPDAVECLAAAAVGGSRGLRAAAAAALSRVAAGAPQEGRTP